MREPKSPRRSGQAGQKTRPKKSGLRPDLDVSGAVRDVLVGSGAPADIRERLDDVLRSPEVDRYVDLRPGKATVVGSKTFETRKLAPALVLKAIDKLDDLVADHPKPGRLQSSIDRLLATLREFDPKALPNNPLAEGAGGIQLPLPDKLTNPLMRQAAAEVAKAGERVLWDDGVNQLLVEIGGILTETGDRRVIVTIPVACDQTKAKMRVPFATGGKDQITGLVTAAPDRPLGDELIARIWGDALIALAHSSLLSMVEALAAASGRDERNEKLVPRAIHAEPGILRIDTEARKRLKGVVR